MLQPRPSSPPEQGLVQPALISIAGQWKSAAGRHGRGADPATKRLHQPAAQRDPTLGSTLGISSASPAAVWCPASPQLRPLSAGGCRERVTLRSQCRGVSAWARWERGPWLFPLSSSQKQRHPLSSQAAPEPPSPNLTHGQPSRLTTVQFLWRGCCCKGPRNQLINRNQDPRV